MGDQSPRGKGLRPSLIRLVDPVFLSSLRNGVLARISTLAISNFLSAGRCPGSAGIVVSKHGGRALDHTPGTAEVLPEIAPAVKGKIKVLVDGGVRSGTDVLKMLALGAEGVLLGRPMAVVAVGGGQEGVRLLLNQYADQLRTAMIYTGCASLTEITPSILRG